MLLAPLFFIATALATPLPEPVWIVDSVRIAPNRKEAALDYYRSAWLPARKEALRIKLILDYKAILLDDDSKEGTRIILMTKFAKRADIEAAEPTWQRILKEVAPKGAKLPEGLKSGDIRTIIRSDRGIEPF